MLTVLGAVLADSLDASHNAAGGPATSCIRLRSTPDRRPSIARILAAIFVLVATVAFCTRVDAQVTFGSVIGTVSDSSGGLIAAATVKVTNVGTNETRSVQTTSGGTYACPNLAAGQYRVEIEAAGFKRFAENAVIVQVGVATPVDATLEVGSVTQSVEVAAEGTALQTDNASLGTTISEEEVQSIPLSGRNINNMLTLVPGVTAQGGTYGNAVGNQTNGSRTNSIGFGNYSIGGGFGNQSSFYIDGVSSNAPAGNLNSLIPSQDVVQEFRVNTNDVGAQYGNYAGGVINITTKSGSNAFHGSGYEYLRNKVLNANDYFNRLEGVSRPPLIQNQFGGTIGGPIRKDKTFFFFGFEREVVHTATLLQTSVPTAAELAGDFSAAGLPPIYDQSQPGDPQFQCNGVLNVICPDRINQTAAKILTMEYPTAPNRPGFLNNFVVPQAVGGVNNQYNARVDHHFSDKNTIFARYANWKVDSNPYDDYGNRSTGQGKTGLLSQEAILGDTHAFNPTTILDLRLSFVRVFQHELPLSTNVDLSQFGPNWAALTPQLATSPGLPTLTFADMGGVTSPTGTGSASELFWHQNMYALTGNLTKVVGRHQVKFGGELRRVQWISSPNDGSGGLNLSFNQFATAQSVSVGGDSIASALLGIPATTATTFINGSRAYYTSYGFFAEDTFQATRKLTITAGLRWDQPSVFSEVHHNDTVFLPNEASPLGSFLNPATGEMQQLTGNVALVDSPAWPSHREDYLHWKLFSPRVGIAYRVTDKTVLRAGYGISYPPTTLSQDGPNLSPINGAPTSNTNSFEVQTGQPNSIIATADNPFPAGIVQPPGRTASPDFFYGQHFIMRVPGNPTPYVQQWNEALEQQIGKDATLTLAYAGSKGNHLLLQGFATVPDLGLNELPEQDFALGPAALLAQVPNPFFGIITTPGSPEAAPTIAVGQLLRPYPQYGSIAALDPHKGKSSYNSFQASFMKRFGGSGILSVAYTYSRLMSNTDSITNFLDEQSIFGGLVQDDDHLDREYSVSSYDIPNNLSIGYGLDLPFGRNKRWMGDVSGVPDKIISGWRVNGITILRSGIPFGATQFVAGSAIGQFAGEEAFFAPNLYMRPDFTSGCKTSVSGSREERAATGWFNTSCFTPVDTNSVVRFGDAPRINPSIRLDPTNNWDFSIAKRTPITEGVALQFTAEFYNIFNRTRFAGPSPISNVPGFGTITSDAGQPRAIQFGLRLSF